MLNVGLSIQAPTIAKGCKQPELPQFDEIIDPKVLQVHLIEPPQSPQKFTIDDYRATTTVSGVMRLSHSEPRRFGAQILPEGVLFGIPQPTTDRSVTNLEARPITVPVNRKPWLGLYHVYVSMKRTRKQTLTGRIRTSLWQKTYWVSVESVAKTIHDFFWKDGQTIWMASKFELVHHLSKDSEPIHRPIH